MAQSGINHPGDVLVADMDSAVGQCIAFGAQNDGLGAARAGTKPEILLDWRGEPLPLIRLGCVECTTRTT